MITIVFQYIGILRAIVFHFAFLNFLQTNYYCLIIVILRPNCLEDLFILETINYFVAVLYF